MPLAVANNAYAVMNFIAVPGIGNAVGRSMTPLGGKAAHAQAMDGTVLPQRCGTFEQCHFNILVPN